jgi:hypothetical protein
VSKLPGERDAAPARTLRTDSPLGCPLLPGDLLQRLATGPGATLRQYELLLRRLMCVLHPRADAAAGTIHADPQASTQAVEVVLALTDWDRWSKAGFGKEHAWCAVHVLRCLLLVGWVAHSPLHGTNVGRDSAICWGMLSTLTASGMLEEAAAFLQVCLLRRRDVRASAPATDGSVRACEFAGPSGPVAATCQCRRAVVAAGLPEHPTHTGS